MRTPHLLLPLLAVLAACVPEVADGERACPCSDGWQCCADVCVPRDAFCPPDPPPPDTTPPAPPRLDGPRPASPTMAREVTLAGTTEPRARVHVYAHGACAADTVAVVQADGNGTFGLTVPLPPDVTTHFSARAEDAAGNVSACSAGGVSVTHDGRAPDAPTFTSVTPPSPSRSSTQPVLSGRAEPGARIVLYADAQCVEALPYASVADAQGDFQVWARAAPNAATVFHARAVDAVGHASACSDASLPFVHDDRAPDAVRLVHSEPASPSRERAVVWTGLTEPHARVRLFSDAGCAAVASPQLQADAQGGWTLAFTAVDNGLTRLWAFATDAADNTSTCAELGYHWHDSLPPEEPVTFVVSPRSPGNSATPTLQGLAADARWVRVFSEPGCAPAHQVAEAEVTATRDFAVQVPVDRAENTYFLQGVDAAGNVSTCPTSPFRYTYDATPPGAPSPLVFSAPSPVQFAPQRLSLLGGVEAGAQVEVFTSGTCDEATRVGTASAQANEVPAGPSFRLELWNAFTVSPWRTFWLRVRDAARNVSPCLPAGGLGPAQPGAGAWTGEMQAELVGQELRYDAAGRLYRIDMTTRPDGERWRDVQRRAPGKAFQSLGLTEGWVRTYAVTPAGDVLAVWQGAGQLRAARYDDAGGTWEASLPVHTVAGTLREVVAAWGPGGWAWLCWSERAPGDDTSAPTTLACAGAPPGGPWGAPVQLASDPTLEAVTVLPGADGRVRVAWLVHTPGDNPGATFDLHLRARAPDGAWGAGTVSATVSGPAALDVAPDGTAWLAYRVPKHLTPSRAVHVHRSLPGALEWEAAQVVAPEGSAAAGVSLGAGADGEVVVAWQELPPEAGGNGPIVLRHASLAEGWGPRTVVPADGPGVPARPLVRWAGPGRAWVTWVQHVGRAERADVRALVSASRYTRAGGAEAQQPVAWDPDRPPDVSLRDSRSVAADAQGRLAASTFYPATSTGSLPPLVLLRVFE